jgi:hypothetical protein
MTTVAAPNFSSECLAHPVEDVITLTVTYSVSVITAPPEEITLVRTLECTRDFFTRKWQRP